MELNKIVLLVRSAHSDSRYSQRNIVDVICRYIIDHLEASCTTEEIAKEFHYSAHYIRHIFKRETGISITDFKNAQIIKKAKILLRISRDKITEIADACGFENPSYFTEVFTKEVGVSPSEYRMQNGCASN